MINAYAINCKLSCLSRKDHILYKVEDIVNKFYFGNVCLYDYNVTCYNINSNYSLDVIIAI